VIVRRTGTLALMFATDRIQDLVGRLREDVRGLVQSEIDLAKAEVRDKVKTQGKGAALAGVAAVLALFALVALLIAAILALDIVMPAWAAALVVGGVLLLLAAILALVAKRKLSSGPPVPNAAISEAKATVDLLKEEVRGS
jgi:uncharacterized membrane protein YqjE